MLVVALVMVLAGVQSGRPVIGLAFGLAFGLTFGLVLGLSFGQIEKTSYPNQNIILTARNSFFTFFIVLLFTGLPIGLAFGVYGGLAFGLFGGLFFGLPIGLSVGGSVGGISIIKHYLLRYFLTRKTIFSLGV